jgi:transposase-like protein
LENESPPIKPEEWWKLAAALMVRHGLSLREAAHELGIELSVAEADALSKRVLFREILG